MPALPVILANGTALAAVGQAAESAFAIGEALSLSLQSTTGYLSFAWRLTTRPAGSTAALTSSTGTTSSLTTDVVGEYRIKGTAVGVDGTVSTTGAVIVVRTAGRRLRKVTAEDTRSRSNLTTFVAKVNEALAEFDFTARVINVKAYGAKGDGTTDDTAAIQAAIDAAITSALGGTVWLPEGTYRITDTLTIASVQGLRFRGAGSGTLIKWDGTWVAEAYTPALKLWGCQRVEVGGFVLYVAATKRLSRGIQIATSGAGPYVSSRNVVHDMQMSCAGQIDTGIYVGGGTDANNDFHVIRNVTIQEFGRYGLHVSSLATQAYDITCENFFATGYTWRTTTCNCTGSSDTLTNIPAGTFTAEDVGATIEVEGANYDTNGDPVRMVIAAILSTTSIQLTTNLIYHTLTGATLRYGAQAACNCAAGNVRWTGGATGTSLDASFVLGITGSSGHSITNVNDEGSRVLLRSISGTSGKGTTIDGVRFAGDSVVYDSASGWPYPAIAVSNPGPIEIRNSAIGDPFSGRDMRISWGPQGTDYGAWLFTMLDTHIEADTATSAAVVFTNLPPTDVVGGLYVAGSASKRIGHIERNHGSKSGATTLPMIWRSHKVTVTGSVSFTFAALPEGEPTRLHLVHSGGPHSITFPAHTVVGSAFSHSGDDWFDFWTDGTTLWGKQL